MRNWATLSPLLSPLKYSPHRVPRNFLLFAYSKGIHSFKKKNPWKQQFKIQIDWAMVTSFMEDSSKTTIEFKGTKRDVGGTSYLFSSWIRGGQCEELMPALTQPSGWDGGRQNEPGPRLCHGMLLERWILETTSSWHVKRNTYQEETEKALFKKRSFRQKSRNDGSRDF